MQTKEDNKSYSWPKCLLLIPHTDREPNSSPPSRTATVNIKTITVHPYNHHHHHHHLHHNNTTLIYMITLLTQQNNSAGGN